MRGDYGRILSILLFRGGPAWPFHLATFISVLAGLEEIAITLLLDRPCSDVRSLLTLLKQRNT